MKKALPILIFIAILATTCFSQSFVQGPSTNYSIGEPRLVDFNDDGKTDVLGLEKFGFGSVGDLVIYINESNIDSIAFNIVELDFRGIGTPVVADLDGDDDFDIIASEWNGSNAIIVALYNQGDFQFIKDTISQENLYRHHLADLDGDNDLDLISTNRDSDVMQIHLNEGDGSYSADETLNRSDLYAAKVSDFDEDGDVDIIIGFDDFFDSFFVLWNNDGSGNFTEEPIFTSSIGSLKDFEILDFDKNGTNDIVFFGNNSPFLRVVLQTSIDIYEERTILTSSSAIAGFSLFNYDSENNKDVLLGGDNQADINFYLNQNSGPFDFEDAEFVSGVSPASFFEQNDLDGDGDMDVIVSNGDFWWLENRLPQGTVNVSEQNFIELKIYPNPFDEEIYIEHMEEGQSIAVFDVMGNKILEKNSMISRLDFNDYKSGVYLMKISDTSKKLSRVIQIIKK